MNLLQKHPTLIDRLALLVSLLVVAVIYFMALPFLAGKSAENWGVGVSKKVLKKG